MSEEIKKLDKDQIENVRKELLDQGVKEEDIDKYLKHAAKDGVIVDKKEACSHEMLDKLHDQTFQCSCCGVIIQIVEALIYSKEGYVEETLKTLKEVKGVEEWKKKHLKLVS